VPHPASAERDAARPGRRPPSRLFERPACRNWLQSWRPATGAGPSVQPFVYLRTFCPQPGHRPRPACRHSLRRSPQDHRRLPGQPS